MAKSRHLPYLSLGLWLGLLLASALSVSAVANAQGLKAAVVARYIEVNGEGKIYAKPDIARLTLRFSHRSKKALQGKKIIDEQVDKLLDLAQQLDIEEKDIHATGLTIHPEYDRKNNRQLTGYNVNREVQLTLRDLNQYPRLLEDSVAIGASPSGQLQLDFSNRKQLADKALQAAFKYAKHQAALLALASGDSLGQTLWIRSSDSGSAPAPKFRMAMMAEQSSGGHYPTGEMALLRHVQVRFALIDE